MRERMELMMMAVVVVWLLDKMDSHNGRRLPSVIDTRLFFFGYTARRLSGQARYAQKLDIGSYD